MANLDGTVASGEIVPAEKDVPAVSKNEVLREAPRLVRDNNTEETPPL